MNRFAVAFVAVLALASRASAGVEIGGIAGLHVFGEKNGVGIPKTNETVKQANSALFAARIGLNFTKMFGVELEGGLIPTESSGTNTTFDIYDIVGRVQAIAMFRNEPQNKVVPFALVGAGIMNVAKIGTSDDSLFNKESGGEFHLGGGVKYRAGGGWGVRFDARAIVGGSKSGGAALDYELLASLYRDFGWKPAPKKAAPKDEDPDKDGISGSADNCPNDPEDKDGFEDDNGCPDPDNDADGIPDASDKCPAEPEDKDGFQDDDGCPDPDNDGDGVPDTSDKCVADPETKNGFEDEDGCPDTVPEKLAKFTGTIQGINFKTSSADLLPGSTKVLDKAIAVLTEFKDVKLEIQGHTDDVALKNTKKYADNDALSQARAETVKAYFVKKGIAEDRVVAKGYGSTKPLVEPSGLKGGALAKARTQNRRVEFVLISNPGEAPAEAPAGDQPKTDAPKADAPKADAPKADAPKADAPKADAPKADAPKADAPKADAPKADAPKADDKK